MDYVPLAISLVAQVSTGHSCQYLLQRWRAEHTSLLETGPDRQTSVNVSISLSLKSITIAQNPEAVELLSVISHLPDGLLHWKINVENVSKKRSMQ